MIRFITGTLHSKDIDELIVLVAGIGYGVRVPSRVAESLIVGAAVELYTYQHIREDALDLYGFTVAEDRQFFEQLISVSGVGPKIALAVLSQFSADEVKRAIIHSDTTFLTSISGIGKKTAQRMILDLKEQVAFSGAASDGVASVAGTERATVNAIDALLALGYSQSEAVAALQGIDSTLPVEEQVRQALRTFHAT
ncbi:MAG: Holliday junction branch migration protein RuvA [Candidatus Kerfeldbacteria bacterium]|nr:Holliday junction branch migration protein RuvA [Candidatus Kerfeldbacteria bacterium]